MSKTHNTKDLIHEVWSDKYKHESDETPSDSNHRIAEFVAGQKYNPDFDHEFFQKAFELLEQKLWMPAGRHHAGAGTGHYVSLFNCFVSQDIPDSLDGIFDTLKQAGMTQQMGGGIGMDFSTLRPAGALVRKLGVPASGPIPFMHTWNSMCQTIMSAGTRRGAMMATLRCDHPDIETFIEAKQDGTSLRMFNVSVLVTDEFMEAVKLDSEWLLTSDVPKADKSASMCVTGKYLYKVVRARDLWEKIIRSTYDHAEPGVIFIDRINHMNNLAYCEHIHCTNPCGEQPLPADGNCNLGHINLARCVVNSFKERAIINYDLIRRTVEVGVDWLDRVIDLSNYPTPEQEAAGKSVRRIGLGVAGLGNMLQQHQLRYGSDEAVARTETVMQYIAEQAYLKSIELAKERGPFPNFNRDEFLERPFVKQLDSRIQDEIAKHGIRNGVLLTIAPTGTTSIYYGNISGGIEPVFDLHYTRKTLQPDGSFKEYQVEDYGYTKYKEHFGDDRDNVEHASYMATAQELSVDDHLRMQAACQKWVDASVSKTINVPTDTSFESFKDVYMKAYDMGLKGCTTYRPNPDSGRGAVLETKTLSEEESEAVLADKAVDSILSEDRLYIAPKEIEFLNYQEGAKKLGPLDKIEWGPNKRPETLQGTTYKLRWPGMKHSYYITINDTIDESGQRRPFECFINSKEVQHAELLTALTLTLTAVFRKDLQIPVEQRDLKFLIKDFKAVHMKEGYFIDKQYMPSIIAQIGTVIERHMQMLGLIKTNEPEQEGELGTWIDHPAADAAKYNEKKGEICPACGAPALIKQEGCEKCQNCGYSTC